MAAKKYAIGIDIGGTKIQLGLVDERGQVSNSIRLKTDHRGPEAVILQLTESIHHLKTNVEGVIAGVGVGIPGQVDSISGIIHFAPNLKWEKVPFAKLLLDEIQLPVKITNDVRAIAWGEWSFGAGRGIDQLICLFVGTGIGSGIVCNGQFLTGQSNSAGEVGHMIIDLNGPICRCGNRGCFEALAGGYAIGKKGREAVQSQPKQGAFLLSLVGGNLDLITTETIVKGYREHDPLSMEILENVLNALVAGCTSLVNAFNPKRLILGGGVIDGLPELVALIENGVRSNALKISTQTVEVVASVLGREAGVIGAAALMLKEV